MIIVIMCCLLVYVFINEEDAVQEVYVKHVNYSIPQEEVYIDYKEELRIRIQQQIHQDINDTYYNTERNLLLFRQKYNLLPKQEVYINNNLYTLSRRDNTIINRGYSIQEVV